MYLSAFVYCVSRLSDVLYAAFKAVYQVYGAFGLAVEAPLDLKLPFGNPALKCCCFVHEWTDITWFITRA